MILAGNKKMQGYTGRASAAGHKGDAADIPGFGDSDPMSNLAQSLSEAVQNDVVTDGTYIAQIRAHAVRVNDNTPKVAAKGSGDRGVSDISPRANNTQSIVQAGDDLFTHLQQLAEGFGQTLQAWGGLRSLIDKLEEETRRSDGIEREQRQLQLELAKLKREHESTCDAMAARTAELSASRATAEDLRTELDKERRASFEAAARIEQLNGDLSKSTSDMNRLKGESLNLFQHFEDEVAARQESNRARQEVSAKLAHVQHAEIQVRNKLREIGSANDALTARLSKALAEREELYSRLTAADQECATLKSGLATAWDRLNYLERSVGQDLRRSPATTYAPEPPVAARVLAKRTHELDARATKGAESRFSEIGNAYDRVDAEIQRLRTEISATGKKALPRR